MVMLFCCVSFFEFAISRSTSFDEIDLSDQFDSIIYVSQAVHVVVYSGVHVLHTEYSSNHRLPLFYGVHSYPEVVFSTRVAARMAGQVLWS
jgi:hypothetical protein